MKVLIPSASGVNVAASVFYPLAANSSDNLIIINNATGVSANFYYPFAEFASGKGFTVVTYDYYRDSGYSKKWRDTVVSFGENDFEAVLRWSTIMFPKYEIHVVSHGLGGGITGFAKSLSNVTSLLNIGSRVTSHVDWPRNKFFLLFLFSTLFRNIRLSLFGSLNQIDTKEINDPVFAKDQQWNLRVKSSDISKKILGDAKYFRDFTGRLLTVGLQDDVFTYSENEDELHRLFPNASRNLRNLFPDDVDEQHLGFFGFFLSRKDDPLWNMALDWIADNKVITDFSYAKFDDSQYPMVVITISNRDPTDEMIREYFVVMKDVLERGPVYLLIDLSNVHWANKRFGKAFDKWIQVYADLIRKNHRCTVYVAPNFFIRNFLLFFHSLPFLSIIKPVKIFKNYSAGISWLKSQVQNDAMESNHQKQPTVL